MCQRREDIHKMFEGKGVMSKSIVTFPCVSKWAFWVNSKEYAHWKEFVWGSLMCWSERDKWRKSSKYVLLLLWVYVLFSTWEMVNKIFLMWGPFTIFWELKFGDMHLRSMPFSYSTLLIILKRKKRTK